MVAMAKVKVIVTKKETVMGKVMAKAKKTKIAEAETIIRLVNSEKMTQNQTVPRASRISSRNGRM